MVTGEAGTWILLLTYRGEDEDATLLLWHCVKGVKGIHQELPTVASLICLVSPCDEWVMCLKDRMSKKRPLPRTGQKERGAGSVPLGIDPAPQECGCISDIWVYSF